MEGGAGQRVRLHAATWPNLAQVDVVDVRRLIIDTRSFCGLSRVESATQVYLSVRVGINVATRPIRWAHSATQVYLAPTRAPLPCIIVVACCCVSGPSRTVAV